jgi:hypothetical protein
MKITVAVPTIAGRAMYLASCLRTCVSQDEDFEILVSDNSAGGEAREVAEALNDCRIRYVSPPSYLPMSAHWDFVLTQVTGEALTIIGDDDGLMPGCVKRVREIRSQVGDMPIHHALCDYRWPDYIYEETRNKVYFFHAAGWGSKVVESSDFLNRIARAQADYKDGPMVYHNFVPMRLIRSLTDDGVFFRRASPDMYSSLAIAGNCPQFYSTEEVLTINGQGAKGNGAAFVAGGAREFTAEMEDRYAPRFNSRTIQMHLLDSLTEVSEHFNRPELLRVVRFAAHAARALAEARHMYGWDDEVRQLLALIRERHAVAATAASVASLVLQKFVRKLRPSEVDRTKAFRQGELISLDASVRNIFDASRAVADLLTNAPVSVAPSKGAYTVSPSAR